MRKRIAVFICAICYDNQKKVLRRIIDEAKKADVDIFVFTCHVNYETDEITKAGAFEVMNLPDINRFDGAIIMRNSIQNHVVSDNLVKRILKSSFGVGRHTGVSIDEINRLLEEADKKMYEAKKEKRRGDNV